MTRSRRAAWNYLSNLGLGGVSLFLSIVSTPVLLNLLGEEQFGAFRVACDWGNYLTLLELGLGGALSALFAQAIGTRDRQAVVRCIRTGVVAYVWVGLGTLAAVGLLALALPTLVPVSAGLRGPLVWGFLLGQFGVLWLPLAPFRYFAEANQQSYLLSLLLCVQAIIVVSLSVLLAWAGWGLPGQFLAVSIGSVPLSLLLAVNGLWQLRHAFPAGAWSGGHAPAGGGHAPVEGSSPESIRHRLWRLNGPTLLHNLAGRVSLLTDNIIVGFFLGPQAVPAFLLTQRPMQLLQWQLQSIGGASWAGLAELYYSGKTERFQQRLVELTKLTAVACVAVLVTVAVCNHSLIRLWVGEGLYAGDLLTWLAAANVFFQSVFSLWGWVFNATGKIRVIVPMMLVGAAVNLTISVLATWGLGPDGGLVGPVVGSFCMYVGYTCWRWPALLHATFGVRPGLLLRAAGGPLLLGAPYALFLGWVSQVVGQPGWVELGLLATAGVAGYLLLAWLLAFSREEQAAWKERLVHVMPVWFCR
jgi:O-antigen/teichoic acid export membrane protein